MGGIEDCLETQELVLLIAETCLMITHVLCVHCACVTLPVNCRINPYIML